MKNKLILTALLGLLLVGSFSYAEENDDEAKKRLLKEYEKVQKEKEKEAEEAAKRQAEEGTQSAQDIANQATENVDGTVVEGGEVAVVQEEVAPKKSRKNMTESEKMDEEIQRIKKRMLEINDKIENYNKTNEMLDNLEKNVGELERRVNY